MSPQQELKEVKKTNAYRTTVITILTGVATAVCVAVFKYIPTLIDAVNDRTFKKVEDRVATEQIIEIYKQTEGFSDLKDHVHDPGVHMPKEAKDSSYVRRDEFEELMSNMAIDNYNQKRTQDEILNKINYQGRVLEIVFDKIQKIENKQ